MKTKIHYVAPKQDSMMFKAVALICNSVKGESTTDNFEYETVNTDELF